MYNDDLRDNVINDLESKKLSIVNTIVSLASQGYFINKNKYIRLDWTSILLDAFENIVMFTEDQQAKIERLYNKLGEI